MLDMGKPERRIACAKNDQIRMHSFGQFENGLRGIAVLAPRSRACTTRTNDSGIILFRAAS